MARGFKWQSLRTPGMVILGYLVAWAENAFRFQDMMRDRLFPPMEGFDPQQYEARAAAMDFLWTVWRVGQAGYIAGLFAATLFLPSVYFVRMLLRARVRAGVTDPMAGLRARPRVTAVVSALPATAWLAIMLSRVSVGETESWSDLLPAFLLPSIPVFLAHYLISRKIWRNLIAPLVDEEEAERARNAEGLNFSAVAVTFESKAAVAALTALTVAMLVAIFKLPVAVLAHNPLFQTGLLTYIFLNVGSAVFFWRASRIAVGLDGIYISGSSRARFVPFTDVDGVRAAGSNLDLLRGTKVVLRLQLHGEDALRRDALAERLIAAIRVAERQRNEPTVEFVRGADASKLERAASGAGNYREVAPTRETLWDILDSPAVDAKGRATAATALARGADPTERGRLRRIADQCAEPTVRARIVELLEDAEPAQEEAEPAARSAARLAR